MKKQERTIGIDFGLARIGLAISDPTGIFATPLMTLQGGKNLKMAAHTLVETIRNLIKKHEYRIEQLVIGLPLHCRGTESTRSQEVRQFALHIQEEMDIPIHFIDERLTSIQAERSMHSLSRKKRTKYVDTVSGTLILQSFLDSRHQKENGTHVYSSS